MRDEIKPTQGEIEMNISAKGGVPVPQPDGGWGWETGD